MDLEERVYSVLVATAAESLRPHCLRCSRIEVFARLFCFRHQCSQASVCRARI